jgi:elongation factor G
MADDVKLVRSVGVVGQGGVGKTSLADALVFAAGAATRLGRVDEGSSVFDFEPEEVRRKTTLTTALCTLSWKKHEITVVDMPGYANFLPDALNCLRACTGVILTLAPAADELRVEAEKLWARAAELQLPVIAFVSRMDRERASFEAAVADLQKILGAKPVMIQYPIGAADSFRGVVDLVSMRALIAQPDGTLKEGDIPADLKDEAQAAREQMIELAAEANDTLTERYLENGTLTNDEIVEALREGTVNRRFTPVLCGSASKAIGMQPLLDATIGYLASAADLGTLQGIDAKIKEPIERRPDVGEPFSAFVFKTSSIRSPESCPSSACSPAR